MLRLWQNALRFLQPVVVLEPSTPSPGPGVAPPPSDNLNITLNSVSISPLLAPTPEPQVAAFICLCKGYVINQHIEFIIPILMPREVRSCRSISYAGQGVRMLLTYMDSDMLQHMPLSVQPLVVCS